MSKREDGPVGTHKYLEMRGIVKDFPGVRALNRVNLDLQRGEIHALVGENGAGKSTLIKILTGVYCKDEGTIVLDGKQVEIDTTHESQRLGIACIYQELNLVPDFDVARNIYLGIEPVDALGKINWKKMYQGAGKLLDDLGVEIDLHTPVKKLGMGQRQMIIIARALLRNPLILILDEPTAMLSRAEIQYLFDLLRKLKEQNVGILYISHRMEEVFEIADRISVMRDGANAGTLDTKDTDTDEVVLLMVGRQLDEMYPKGKVTPGSVALEVHDLNDGKLVSDVDFTIASGEVIGIYGVLGSGTTELGQMLVGDREIVSGEIKINGDTVKINSPQAALGHGLALIPKDRREEGLILSFSVKESMTLANLRSFCRLGLINSKKESTVVNAQVKSLAIRAANTSQLVRELSGGNQQKVVISKAMLSNARIFVFDEPTRGVDVGAKVEIYKLMSKLVEEGASIIFFSSEISEILHISDRVIVMFRGSPVLEKPAKDTNSDELLMFALKGKGQNA